MIISRSIHVAANGIISVFVIMPLIFFFLVSLPPALLPPQAVHLTRVQIPALGGPAPGPHDQSSWARSLAG